MHTKRKQQFLDTDTVQKQVKGRCNFIKVQKTLAISGRIRYNTK